MLSRLRSFLSPVEHKSAGISISDPAVLSMLGGTLPTAAGVSVSPETAMRCAPVFASVKVIAETVQLLPLRLYRKTPDGGREKANDHPVYPLVARAANPWTPASEFRLILTTHLALYGNAYAFVSRDSSGRPVELIALDPRGVSVRPDLITMEPRYIVTLGTAAEGQITTREYSRADVLHIRGVGIDTYKGTSPVTEGREAIGLAMTLESHSASLFGRGAKPSGVLKLKGKKTEEAFKRIRAMFSQFYHGPDGKKTMILDEDMEFQQVQLNSVDAQTLEMRRFQIEEVSRFWRVPLHLINELDRATHNNAESMGQQFLTYCMLPILRLWCDSAGITLLTPDERDEYFFDFEVNDIARADIAARFEAYSKAINAGVLNPNEARALENRPAYDGGETFMRPVNTAPAPSATSPEAA
jgi:HK97 family phage portal protein